MFLWVRLSANVILRNVRHNIGRYAITQSSSSSSTWFRYIHLLFLGLEVAHCKRLIKTSAVTCAKTMLTPTDALQQIQQSGSWVLSASGRLKSSCSYEFMPFSTALRRCACIPRLVCVAHGNRLPFSTESSLLYPSGCFSGYWSLMRSTATIQSHRSSNCLSLGVPA